MKNGAAPNTELPSRVSRCQYGEKPAVAGRQAAVRRIFDTRLDMGGGTHRTTFVYPVKVTFTYKTFGTLQKLPRYAHENRPTGTAGPGMITPCLRAKVRRVGWATLSEYKWVLLCT